ncbi:phosphoinositide phosphatase SAC6-like protein [Tanacetum coccineum]
MQRLIALSGLLYDLRTWGNPTSESQKEEKIEIARGVGLVAVKIGKVVGATVIVVARWSVGMRLRGVQRRWKIRLCRYVQYVSISLVWQKKMESQFSSMLKIAENNPGLYFSYDVNITLSAQSLNDLGDESRLLPL